MSLLRIDQLEHQLRAHPVSWLVTGAAGFIGSHLVERLLGLGQTVVGLDNLATGSRTNLDAVRAGLDDSATARFRFMEGDIRDATTCREAAEGAEVVLHQAALGSVPRSVESPELTHDNNVTGTLNMLRAARDAGVRQFVYASSSSVYGDQPDLPKIEDHVGRPLSPYAASKACTELYAHSFARCYDMRCVGLRYFNVYGPRQDPHGPYAAVIPKWIDTLSKGEPVTVNGDLQISRDFTYVQNVVDANLLAGMHAMSPGSWVCNIAFGGRVTLQELHAALVESIAEVFDAPGVRDLHPIMGPLRPGDIPHSFASIDRASEVLGYVPRVDVAEGIRNTVQWFGSAASTG